MIRAKTIYIIPGYRHSPSYSAYKRIVALLQDAGYRTIPVTIPWTRTISENTKYFLEEYRKLTSKNKYILGFSFGAMIAFLASTKVNVKGLVLCSLSPYFKEDLPKIGRSDLDRIKKLYFKDFSKLSSQHISKKTKAEQILMLYGSKEAKALIRRVTETYEQIPLLNKSCLRIRETEHNIGDRKYLNKIKQVIKLLD